MQEGYWVVRTYEAGAVGEKTKFWVCGSRPSGASRRKEKAEIKKQEQNEYSALKQMARLMNANYTSGDLLLGLDYSDAGIEHIVSYAKSIGMDPDLAADEAERLQIIYEAAEHEMRLCLRRVNRELSKDEAALRYIAITSDMDGDTGEQVRVHHHLVVPADVGPLFVKKWETLGTVDWTPLKVQADYTPIAEYFIRQVRRIPDAKKFVSSRNLVRPRPKDRVVNSDAELRAPRGSKLLFRSEFRSGKQPRYIRYTIPVKASSGYADDPPLACI